MEIQQIGENRNGEIDRMNKKVITIIFCLLATVVCLLYSCTADNDIEEVKFFEEPVQAENNQDIQVAEEKQQIPGQDEIIIEGEAPKEDEYEPEIYDGY